MALNGSRKKKAVPNHQNIGSEEIPNYIDALPEPVLSSIISLLPVQEAVATSVLSRKWENLWRYLSHLDINPVKIMEKERERNQIGERPRRVKQDFLDSIPVIDHILECQKSDLISFRIIHRENVASFWTHMIKWIEFLKEKKRIEKLVLKNDVRLHLRRNGSSNGKARITFPSRFFDCGTLNSLELGKYILVDATPFEGCVNLVTLVLDSVTVSDGTLNAILSNSTSLENLTIKCCVGLKSVEIYKETLKHVEIQLLKVSEFKLIAENLLVLAVNNLLCFTENVAIYCPSIRVLRAHWTPNKDCYENTVKYVIHHKILDQCSGLLEIGSIGNLLSRELNGSPLENLRELYICFDLDDIKLKVLLRFIFSVSPHLRKLELTNQPTPSELINPLQPENISWDKMELHDCVSHQLKIVRIKGFTGKPFQIQFVSYFINNALKMDELEIEYDNMLSEKEVNAAKGFLFEPLASPNARITIKPGPHIYYGI